MKHRKLFSKILRAKRQKGQSLIEFVFLFVLIVFWGLLIIREAHELIANYWEALLKIIVNDPSQNTQIR